MLSKTSYLGSSLCLRCQLRLLQTTKSASSSRPISTFSTASLRVLNSCHGSSPTRQAARRQLPSSYSPRLIRHWTEVSARRRYAHNAADAVSRDDPAQPAEAVTEEPLAAAGKAPHPPGSPGEVSHATENGAEQIAEGDEAAVGAEEIWNTLLEEGTAPTEDAVYGYINELKPTDETVVPLSEFNRLTKTLGEGFTAAQLHRYIRAHRRPLAQPVTYDWELSRRPWVPDDPAEENTKKKQSAKRKTAAASAVKEAAGGGRGAREASTLLLRGYIEPTMSNKVRLAVQVQRECWGLAVRERMEAPGHLDITLLSLPFALIQTGTSTWLRDIATAFSTVTTMTSGGSRNHGESRSETRLSRHIELLPDQRVLRIHAPAATADAIAAEIDIVLGRAQTRQFKLSDVVAASEASSNKKLLDANKKKSKKQGKKSEEDAEIEAAAQPEEPTIDESTLQALGALTRSWVRFAKVSRDEPEEDAQVLVSWIAPKEADPAVENTGDVVYRLLLQAYGPKRQIVKSTLEYKPQMRKSRAQFVVDRDGASRDKWMWAHGLPSTTWARWVEPGLSNTAESTARKDLFAPSPGALPIEFWVPPSPTSPEQGTDPGQILFSTVATFGHVLHAQPPSLAAETTVVPPAEGEENKKRRYPPEDLERIISPCVPPLLGIQIPWPDPRAAPSADGSSAASESAITKTSIQLRFLPKPSTDVTHGSPPPLEVYLDLASGDELEAAATPHIGPGIAFSALHAVIATNTCDVLFPLQPVDIRVAQKRLYAVQSAHLDKNVSNGDGTHARNAGLDLNPLWAFLQQSQLHPDAGPLSTPATLPQMKVPGRLLVPDLFTVLHGKRSAVRERQAATVLTDYVLAGLEVRRRVATSFEGWTLALTSIDGGLGGGRRTELTLEAAPFPAGAESGAITTNNTSGNDQTSLDEVAGEDADESDAAGSRRRKTDFRFALGRLMHKDTIQWVLPDKTIS